MVSNMVNRQAVMSVGNNFDDNHEVIAEMHTLWTIYVIITRLWRITSLTSINSSRRQISLSGHKLCIPQPLSDKILEASIPEIFKSPILIKFNVISNPQEHVTFINT